MRLLGRRKTQPLPPLRPTSDILEDINQQVGRLSFVRERAIEVINRLKEEDDDDAS
jgi:hypothetical protein